MSAPLLWPGVTSAFLPAEGKILESTQALNSVATGEDMTGEAILRILALILSCPGALFFKDLMLVLTKVIAVEGVLFKDVQEGVD